MGMTKLAEIGDPAVDTDAGTGVMADLLV